MTEQEAKKHYDDCLSRSSLAYAAAWKADRECEDAVRECEDAAKAWQEVCVHEFGAVYTPCGYPSEKCCKKCGLAVEVSRLED